MYTVFRLFGLVSLTTVKVLTTKSRFEPFFFLTHPGYEHTFEKYIVK